MRTPFFTELSRLESRIVDVLYRLKEANVSEVVQQLQSDSKYDTVRITLGILEKKGFVAHRKEGNRYIYFPTIPEERAKKNVLEHITKTFFGGSAPSAIQALLGLSSKELTENDLDAIESMIAKARKNTK